MARPAAGKAVTAGRSPVSPDHGPEKPGREQPDNEVCRFRTGEPKGSRMDLFAAEKLGEIQVIRIRTDRMTHDMLDKFRSDLLKIVDNGEMNVLLDMKQVVYLDSFGVGVIMEIHRRLRSLGGNLKLCGLQDRVAKMVSITNLDLVLEIFETDQQAIESFSS
jgi:anti-sigma B factor antagonist